MEKRRVLLLCMLPLLCEGLEHILHQFDDVEVVRVECTEPAKLQACLQDTQPRIILIAGEKVDDESTHLLSSVLNRWEDIPVVWVELETNVVRVYTSHSLLANSKDLIETIRQANLAPGQGDGFPGSAQDAHHSASHGR